MPDAGDAVRGPAPEHLFFLGRRGVLAVLPPRAAGTRGGSPRRRVCWGAPAVSPETPAPRRHILRHDLACWVLRCALCPVACAHICVKTQGANFSDFHIFLAEV